MWCEVMVQPISFTCGYPVGPTLVYEEIIFPIFVTFLKYQLIKIQGFISQISIYSIDLYVYSSVSIILSWFLLVCTNFWNQKMLVPLLYSFSRRIWSFWFMCNSIEIHETAFQAPERLQLRSDRYCAESLDYLWSRGISKASGLRIREIKMLSNHLYIY